MSSQWRGWAAWSRGRGGGVGEAFGAVWVVGAPFWAVWGRRHPFGALMGLGGIGTSFWSGLLCLWALGKVGCMVWGRRAPRFARS
jgi:hypothetical protein